MFASFRTVFM